MHLARGNLDDPRVLALLRHHAATARAQTGRGSAHALDAEDLRGPEVELWSAWEGEELLGVGALLRLTADHGEIKSMHVAEAHRRRGVARALLLRLVESARAAGMTRVSLETGAWPYFHAARELYRRHGFVACPPFGPYRDDPNSVFLTRALDATCPFCAPERPALVETPHALAIADAFPVARGHTLILPRRHVRSVFELDDAARADFFLTLARARERLAADLRPDGFTIGVNDGAAAGQTVEHAHGHVIPRWRGDAADPRGGIRLLFPERARYWDA